MKPRMKLDTVAVVLVAALGVSTSFADPMPPRMRQKEERLRQIAEEKKHANDKPPFEFTAPEGFTITKPEPAKPDAAKPDAKTDAAQVVKAPDFAATSITPAATMSAVVEKGAVTVDETLLADQVRKATEKFIAAHASGSAKLVKKELVKLEAGPVVRFVLDTRADGKKGTKAVREIHYLISNATHHAHVTYATSVPSFAKLEKKFDESLRKTHGLGQPATAEAKPTP